MLELRTEEMRRKEEEEQGGVVVDLRARENIVAGREGLWATAGHGTTARG